MPRKLPVVFVAGADDPVGDFEKGVIKVVQQFKKTGMKHVDLKLYENDRHEILNETDRKVVYRDILRWLDKQLKE